MVGSRGELTLSDKCSDKNRTAAAPADNSSSPFKITMQSGITQAVTVFVNSAAACVLINWI